MVLRVVSHQNRSDHSPSERVQRPQPLAGRGRWQEDVLSHWHRVPAGGAQLLWGEEVKSASIVARIPPSKEPCVQAPFPRLTELMSLSASIEPLIRKKSALRASSLEATGHSQSCKDSHPRGEHARALKHARVLAASLRLLRHISVRMGQLRPV